MSMAFEFICQVIDGSEHDKRLLTRGMSTYARRVAEAIRQTKGKKQTLEAVRLELNKLKTFVEERTERTDEQEQHNWLIYAGGLVFGIEMQLTALLRPPSKSQSSA